MKLRRSLPALLLISLLIPGSVFGDATTATLPGTCVNDASVGNTAWSNETGAQTDGGSSASVTLTSTNTSQYLKCTNFGFSIPSGATINGITLDINRRSSSTSFEGKDIVLRIVKADGTIGTSDKADTALTWPSTLTVKTYGSSSDTWGESWTASDINDADFGAALRIQRVDTTGLGQVDYFKITVTYTPAAGGAPETQTITTSIGGGVSASDSFLSF